MEVTGYTAERMKAIEDASIVNGVINASGHLMLTRFDGTVIDAGEVFDERGNIELARAQVTSGTFANSTANTYADITGLSITFTVGSRPVDVLAYVPGSYLSGAGSIWVAVRTSANVLVTAHSQGRAANIVDQFSIWTHLTVPGTYTYKVSYFPTAGTANIALGTSGIGGLLVAFIAAYER